jgi:hypothetical protein
LKRKKKKEKKVRKQLLQRKVLHQQTLKPFL